MVVPVVRDRGRVLDRVERLGRDTDPDGQPATLRHRRRGCGRRRYRGAGGRDGGAGGRARGGRGSWRGRRGGGRWLRCGLATAGGAACLGRDDIGSIEAGKRADIALFDTSGLGFAGAEADPVAALVLCAPRRVAHLIVEGRPVVEDGHILSGSEYGPFFKTLVKRLHERIKTPT